MAPYLENALDTLELQAQEFRAIFLDWAEPQGLTVPTDAQLLGAWVGAWAIAHPEGHPGLMTYLYENGMAAVSSYQWSVRDPFHQRRFDGAR